MRRTSAFLHKTATIAASLLTASSSAQTKPNVVSRVSKIEAKLFYQATGGFSENVLDNHNFSLWNTIIGEGSAAAPSDATLVLVEIAGDGHPNVVHREVLTVTTQIEGKLPTVSRFRRLAFSAMGRAYEAVWLADTGCLPVTITAQIDGHKAMKRKIDFECGE